MFCVRKLPLFYCNLEKNISYGFLDKYFDLDFGKNTILSLSSLGSLVRHIV